MDSSKGIEIKKNYKGALEPGQGKLHVLQNLQTLAD
jgi:hypothetical protein